jgi:hypothetical protein
MMGLPELLGALASGDAIVGALIVMTLIWLAQCVTGLLGNLRTQHEIEDCLAAVKTNNWAPADTNSGKKLVAAEYNRLAVLAGTFLLDPFSPDPRAGRWFDSSLLELTPTTSEHFGERHASILYLVGLAFTFAGLIAAVTYALRSMDLETATDAEKLLASLTGLLLAAAFKFVTSAAGVVLGLLLVAVLRFVRARTVRRLNELRDAAATIISGLKRRGLASDSVSTMNKELKAATEKLKGLEDGITALRSLLNDVGDEDVGSRPIPAIEVLKKLTETSKHSKDTVDLLNRLVDHVEGWEQRFPPSKQHLG